MNVSVFGLGYVGLATSLCLAEAGHCVIGVDANAERIQDLQEQKAVLNESSFLPLLAKHSVKKNISFSTDLKLSAQSSNIFVLCLGTPSKEDGSVDLDSIYDLVKNLAQLAEEHKKVIIKSTVPVGTCDALEKVAQNVLRERNKTFSFSLISNPEFLREDSALQDALSPARIVIGVDNPEDKAFAAEFYSRIKTCPLLFMSKRSSELSKYTANALLAAKVSFMNEISWLAERTGADIEDIRKVVGADPRIGNQFLQVSAGIGGSCLPKDLLGLIDQGKKAGVALNIVQSVEKTNRTQPILFFEKVKNILGDLKERKIAIWGVAFKEGVADIRNSAALTFVRLALQEGAILHVHDPQALPELKKYLELHLAPQAHNVIFENDPYSALENSEALVILTSWKSFREADLGKIKMSLRDSPIFDGQNIFSPGQIRAHQIQYHSLGRQKVLAHEI